MKIKNAHVVPTDGDYVLLLKKDKKLVLPGGALEHVHRKEAKVAKELTEKVSVQLRWTDLVGDKKDLKEMVNGGTQIKVKKKNDLIFFVKTPEIDPSDEKIKKIAKKVGLVFVKNADLKTGLADKNTNYHHMKLDPNARAALIQVNGATLL